MLANLAALFTLVLVLEQLARLRIMERTAEMTPRRSALVGEMLAVNTADIAVVVLELLTVLGLMSATAHGTLRHGAITIMMITHLSTVSALVVLETVACGSVVVIIA